MKLINYCTLTAIVYAALLAHTLPASAEQPSWHATRTHAPDTSEYTAGAEMRDGDTLHISVSLQIRQRDQLEALAARVAAGQEATPLTSEQFKALYAPTAADVAAVVQHLSESGFINITVSANHLLVSADGTVAAARAAFNVSMRHYSNGVRNAYANINDPSVPAVLSNIVLGVHGLQTIDLAHTFHVQAQLQDQNASAPKSDPNRAKRGHNPTEWPTIYNASALPTAANTSIGIISAGDMTKTLADLSSFVRTAGFAQPDVSVVSVKGSVVDLRADKNADKTDDGTIEWDIDSQNALGAAGGVVKSLVFYAAASLQNADLTAAYNAAVDANVAKVINVSLGECELAARLGGTEAADDQIFLVAVAQGQTFVVSTGDSGSYECGGKSNAQSYPAVSPYVMAIGGTAVSTSSSGGWADETVWSCKDSAQCARSGGTGGGVSLTETAPAWQLSSGVLGSSTRRGVPDISFVGDPSTGAIVVFKGKNTQVGGTSLAAPIFTGFWARIQSANDNRLAFPAAAIYHYGVAQPGPLHDVVSGSNGGYSAAKGWDYTTGFGSLDIAGFAGFVGSYRGF